MLNWIRERRRRVDGARRMYEAIVAQSREPAFYRHHGIADSLSGRFDVLALHMFVVLERLAMEGRGNIRLRRALIEAFFSQLDDDMREMGISDMVVPKKMRKAAEAFYGRMGAYAEALRETDQGALAAALARNMGSQTLAADAGDGESASPEVACDALAAYVHRALGALAAQPFEAVANGVIDFPPLANEARTDRSD